MNSKFIEQSETQTHSIINQTASKDQQKQTSDWTNNKNRRNNKTSS